MKRLQAALAIVALSLAGCAGLQRADPPQVTVAGLESLPGEGLEVRMLLKLRVQNPSDAPIVYDGVYVALDVSDRTFATGVSDAKGTVPRFGEAVISIPVTVSVLRMARQVMGMLDGKPVDKITYELRGKLNDTGLGSLRFRSRGDLTLPGAEAASGRDGV